VAQRLTAHRLGIKKVLCEEVSGGLDRLGNPEVGPDGRVLQEGPKARCIAHEVYVTVPIPGTHVRDELPQSYTLPSVTATALTSRQCPGRPLSSQ